MPHFTGLLIGKMRRFLSKKKDGKILKLLRGRVETDKRELAIIEHNNKMKIQCLTNLYLIS
jgi:hypothetical protein